MEMPQPKMLQIWACLTAFIHRCSMCERKRKHRRGDFRRWQNAFTGIHVTASTMPVLIGEARKPSARSERLFGLWRSGSSEISEISSGKSTLTGQPDSGLSCATAGWQQSRTPSRKRSSKRATLADLFLAQFRLVPLVRMAL